MNTILEHEIIFLDLYSRCQFNAVLVPRRKNVA